MIHDFKNELQLLKCTETMCIYFRMALAIHSTQIVKYFVYKPNVAWQQLYDVLRFVLIRVRKFWSLFHAHLNPNSSHRTGLCIGLLRCMYLKSGEPKKAMQSQTQILRTGWQTCITVLSTATDPHYYFISTRLMEKKHPMQILWVWDSDSSAAIPSYSTHTPFHRKCVTLPGCSSQTLASSSTNKLNSACQDLAVSL